MRLLILSDLHANLTAFDAALAAASGKWDAAVCLGDVVGYGPDPGTVSEKLQTITSDVIRGNHDKAVAGIMTSDDFNPVAKMAVEWTQSQLSPELMSWLATLPQGPKKAQGVVLIHGAFQDEDEYVFTPAQALEGLLDSSTALSFFGHTHHQGGFSYHESDIEVLPLRPRPMESFSALHLEPGARPQIFTESRLHRTAARRRSPRRFCNCRFRSQNRGILARTVRYFFCAVANV